VTPNLIIVGGTPAAQQLIRRALRTRDVNILGIFDDRRERVGPEILGVPVLGKTADLIDHRILPYADRIVVTVPPKASARIAQLLERLAPIPNPISLLLDETDDETTADAVGRIADFDLMQFTGPRQRSGYLMAKRAMDLTLSVLALVALAPLMAAVALAIRLDSPGPIFFRQRRHGYMNEEIVVWKFHSMRVESTDHKAARQVTAGDDRITRVGRFIRKTSLDELPQIFNIITGEMSIVGPRPHAIGMLSGGAEASKLVETYAHRHRIKPGLTGWAAVNGSRGPVDTADDVRRRVQLDLEYVERQSFWLDISIILRTAPCLLGDSGAVR
jgi:exopolysaccharide biosynthesis polyprenyl glycosylphosphotransferase